MWILRVNNLCQCILEPFSHFNSPLSLVLYYCFLVIVPPLFANVHILVWTESAVSLIVKAVYNKKFEYPVMEAYFGVL